MMPFTDSVVVSDFYDAIPKVCSTTLCKVLFNSRSFFFRYNVCNKFLPTSEFTSFIGFLQLLFPVAMDFYGTAIVDDVSKQCAISIQRIDLYILKGPGCHQMR